jgi:hypothetical protein
VARIEVGAGIQHAGSRMDLEQIHDSGSGFRLHPVLPRAGELPPEYPIL